MEIPPIYWTILGEIAIVSIGVLIAVIAVILKDRGKLKDYTDYLKDVIKKLKKKLLDNETEHSQEPITELLSDNDDNLNAQLEQASQRIANLEKFKQLYFDLQDRLTTSVEEIEQLNQQIEGLAEGSDNFADIMAISEQNKAQYINMGQMIGMDSASHHDSVAEKMDYSDALINERKDELKRLKHQVARQFEEIWGLQNRLTTTSDQSPNPDELSAGIETMSHSLNDAQMCIETMDMEIQTLSSEITNLRNKLKQQGSAGSHSGNQSIELEKQVQEKDQLIARFIQENKEMKSCIIGLEESNSEQSNTINRLQDKLNQII